MGSPELWKGVGTLLDDYVELASDDYVVLLYTSDSRESAIWVSAALEARGFPVHRVWMAPLEDAEFESRLRPALPPVGEPVGRLVIMSFERDTMSHTRILERVLAPYPPLQVALFRTISASVALFERALRVGPAVLSALNTALLERLMAARRLHVTTRGGTDLTIALDSDRYRWISNRGTARKGGVVILPAGEVATYPASVTGVFVADFAFNVNAVVELDARLDKHPVTIEILDGRVVRYDCDDPETRRFIDDCFQRDCALNVGELGFGTNTGVCEPLALNSHINERRPGIHLGFGQHNQDPGKVHYQCPLHLDLIARGGMVTIDDDPVPINLEKVSPSAAPHPLDSRDEDVFSPEERDLASSDCCGILTGDGASVCLARPS